MSSPERREYPRRDPGESGEDSHGRDHLLLVSDPPALALGDLALALDKVQPDERPLLCRMGK
jgi:hypothetical protein